MSLGSEGADNALNIWRHELWRSRQLDIQSIHSQWMTSRLRLRALACADDILDQWRGHVDAGAPVGAALEGGGEGEAALQRT